MMSVENIIDLRRYPLDQLDSPQGQAFTDLCRAQLERDGALVLDGFLKPEMVKSVLDELSPKFSESYYCSQHHNVYLRATDPEMPADHARNRQVVSDKGCLADDQIPQGSGLRMVYDWPPLKAFIARVLNYEELYPFADPLASLNVNIAQEHQQLGWHFDNSAFAVTLLLQSPVKGGVFQYVPGVRSASDPGYDGVQEILNGTHGGVKELAQAPGALALFRGRYALHTVTPSIGPRPRVVAVLCYDPEPGRMLTEFTRQLFYGRTV